MTRSENLSLASSLKNSAGRPSLLRSAAAAPNTWARHPWASSDAENDDWQQALDELLAEDELDAPLV